MWSLDDGRAPPVAKKNDQCEASWKPWTETNRHVSWQHHDAQLLPLDADKTCLYLWLKHVGSGHVLKDERCRVTERWQRRIFAWKKGDRLRRVLVALWQVLLRPSPRIHFFFKLYFFAKKSCNPLMLFEYDLNYLYHLFAKHCLKDRSILVSEITATTLYHEWVTAG